MKRKCDSKCSASTKIFAETLMQEIEAHFDILSPQFSSVFKSIEADIINNKICLNYPKEISIQIVLNKLIDKINYLSTSKQYKICAQMAKHTLDYLSNPNFRKIFSNEEHIQKKCFLKDILAYCYYNLGEFKLTEDYLLQVQLHSQAMGNQEQEFNTMSKRSRNFIRLKRYSDAESLLKQCLAYELRNKDPEIDHQEIVIYYTRLIQCKLKVIEIEHRPQQKKALIKEVQALIKRTKIHAQICEDQESIEYIAQISKTL